MILVDRFWSGRDFRSVSAAVFRLLATVCMVLGLGAASGHTEEAGGAWVEVRSAHFVVASNAPESAARGVAEDFERIRGLFHSTFPELRVDPAQPIVILAARDEASMKMLAPEEFGGEAHIRPAGLFHSDGEKDYVVLRLDADGTTAYHTVYHEYTHALLHLNFSRLPLWVSEGVSEFFGNSTLGADGARTGTADKTHLYLLSKNEWLPMETLLDVREGSAYYNEKNPASVFYAESWAVVHYLLLAPEARRQQLLRKFLANWRMSGDRVSAGRAAFGDLDRFGETVRRYVRQANWGMGVVLPGQASAAENLSVRTLLPAEVLALRGDFFVRRKRIDAALPLLQQAVALGPEISVTHEALGFYDFRDSDFAAADEEMSKAISLGSASFMAFYCHGVLLLRDFTGTEESTKKARVTLETAAKMNPMYAPTFEALTQAYSRTAETQGRALEAAETAVRLDPESRTYKTNLAYVLLNNRQAVEARVVAEKLQRTAGSLEEQHAAASILAAIDEEEEWEKESGEEALGRLKVDGPHVAMDPDLTPDIVHPAISRRQLGPPEWMAVEGEIGALDCSHSPEVTLGLNLPKGPMDFHASDLGRVGMSGISTEAVPELATCKQWAGRRIKLWFRLVPGKEYLGEIIRIYFY